MSSFGEGVVIACAGGFVVLIALWAWDRYHR